MTNDPGRAKLMPVHPAGTTSMHDATDGTRGKQNASPGNYRPVTGAGRSGGENR
jgi:hypothetical protein